MRKIKEFFAVVAILLSSASAFAQNITVTGAVTEADGSVISGVAIQLKGSSTVYTMTDALGNYKISVPADGTLVYSCLGFQTVEVAVAGKALQNVTLASDSQKLDDVIVVAYGTVRREANTGSVVAMKAEGLAEGPVSSIDKMLQGKVAGVEISSLSGQPGSNSSIRIRGISSINAGNEPLWVVDGIPVITEDMRQMSYYGDGAGGSSTTFINPNDIENITILKDAAAASVYGSRAANGVILVTTKSGRAGKTQFGARVKLGASQIANDNKLRPLSGKELVDYWRAAAINAGSDPDDPTADYYVPYSLLQNGVHSWYDDLTKIGFLQEYEINATGGNDRTSFYSSISYHSNEGVFYGNGYKRLSFRTNIDSQLTKTLKLGSRIGANYGKTIQNNVFGSSYYSNPAHTMFSLFPWTPIYNEDGSWNFPSENGNVNPYANAVCDQNLDQEYRFNGTLYLEYKPIKQLTFKTNNSAEFSYDKTRMYTNPEADYEGSAIVQEIRSDIRRLTTSNTINYTDMFGDHSLHAMAGQEAMLQTYEAISGYSPNIDPAIPYPTTSTTKEDSVGYSTNEESLMSFFGVFDYNYASRYFLQASVRADGSSLFGANKRWGTFWSASASWNISNEKFMMSTRNWLSNLKLRASYGVNGNNNIPAYRAYGVYSASEYNGATTMYPSRPSNEDLSWEKNKTWNVGLDMGFLDNRITATVDVYSRLTTDMLLSVKVPYTSGFGSNLRNIGSLRNRGIELAINGDIIRKGDWNWSVGANLAMNRSLVIDLAGNGFLETTDNRVGSGDYDTPVRIVEGMSMYNFYIRDWAGVNPSNGDGLYWAEDGTLTNNRNKARYIYAGSPEAKCTGGFNTALSWKGLSLSAYFQFSLGNKVLTNNWFISDGEDALNSNSTNVALNYWKKPGDTGCNPKPIAGGTNVWYAGYSSRFLEDGSYLRIKDVTLSYTLPEKATKAMNIKGLKVYVSALNPYTFHHVHSLDPELGELGYAYGGAYPLTKSIVGGIELAF